MSAAAQDDDDTGPEGCYLTYESDSGGKVMLHYSKSEFRTMQLAFGVLVRARVFKDSSLINTEDAMNSSRALPVEMPIIVNTLWDGVSLSNSPNK